MIIKIKDFVPAHTFDCGQCFRWERQGDGSYIGVAGGKAARISAVGDTVSIEGVTEEEYDSFWKIYLDAERDYSLIKKSISINPLMESAANFGSGIRILRQDFFETLISFIISQRSSIPKIKSCINKLCTLYGEKIEFMGKDYYSFPSAEKIASLSEDEVRALGVGYRAPYILRAARTVADGEITGEELLRLDTASARSRLLKLYGVGDKVCDCILLFALGKYDLFPSDVWIKRVMQEEFNTPDAKKTGEDTFGAYSGFAQQYLFYWRKYNKNV